MSHPATEPTTEKPVSIEVRPPLKRLKKLSNSPVLILSRSMLPKFFGGRGATERRRRGSPTLVRRGPAREAEALEKVKALELQGLKGDLEAVRVKTQEMEEFLSVIWMTRKKVKKDLVVELNTDPEKARVIVA
ncbi:hypothetical protein B296_00052194 [Ensete ventricosum]|uniref:Uncharacterized protein n=1 Tax=Ensete ventricosum TaxID=4639 RepID=A0A426XNL0_ENSVE|nr:hypothetical protein B296_00052194 [Ensete ventricosum]